MFFVGTRGRGVNSLLFLCVLAPLFLVIPRPRLEDLSSPLLLFSLTAASPTPLAPLTPAGPGLIISVCFCCGDTAQWIETFLNVTDEAMRIPYRIYINADPVSAEVAANASLRSRARGRVSFSAPFPRHGISSHEIIVGHALNVGAALEDPAAVGLTHAILLSSNTMWLRPLNATVFEKTTAQSSFYAFGPHREPGNGWMWWPKVGQDACRLDAVHPCLRDPLSANCTAALSAHPPAARVPGALPAVFRGGGFQGFRRGRCSWVPTLSCEQPFGGDPVVLEGPPQLLACAVEGFMATRRAWAAMLPIIQPTMACPTGDESQPGMLTYPTEELLPCTVAGMLWQGYAGGLGEGATNYSFFSTAHVYHYRGDIMPYFMDVIEEQANPSGVWLAKRSPKNASAPLFRLMTRWREAERGQVLPEVEAELAGAAARGWQGPSPLGPSPGAPLGWV
jgi:hypothetical protein